MNPTLAAIMGGVTSNLVYDTIVQRGPGPGLPPSGTVNSPIGPITVPPGGTAPVVIPNPSGRNGYPTPAPAPSPSPAPAKTGNWLEDWWNGTYERMKTDAARNWQNFVVWLGKWALTVALVIALLWLLMVVITGENPTPDVTRLNPVVNRIKSVKDGE